MLADLRSLRAALDRAIDGLEPLAGVIAAWAEAQAAQKSAQELGRPSALGEPPRPTPGLFDPLPDPAPAERRPANGASSPSSSCEQCGAPIEQPQRGARRKYCSGACRQAAAAERAIQREATDEQLEPLPDQVERPPVAFKYPDDPRSDPTLLRPPALAWEREVAAP